MTETSNPNQPSVVTAACLMNWTRDELAKGNTSTARELLKTVDFYVQCAKMANVPEEAEAIAWLENELASLRKQYERQSAK